MPYVWASHAKTSNDKQLMQGKRKGKNGSGIRVKTSFQNMCQLCPKRREKARKSERERERERERKRERAKKRQTESKGRERKGRGRER